MRRPGLNCYGNRLVAMTFIILINIHNVFANTIKNIAKIEQIEYNLLQKKKYEAMIFYGTIFFLQGCDGML